MNVVTSLKEALREIEDTRQKKESPDNTLENISELLKVVTTRFEDLNESDANQGLCAELLAEDIPVRLIHHVIYLNNNVTKDVKNFIQALLKYKINSQQPALAYFSSNFAVILDRILNGLENALPENGGWWAMEILTACMKYGCLTVQMLNLATIRRLAQWATVDDFDISGAGVHALRQLLSSQPDLVLEFLTPNFEAFFDVIIDMVDANTRNTGRSVMGLLRNLLFQPTYKQFMLKFVADEPQKYAAFVIEQQLTRWTSYQLDVWHVFKLFVAYPNKTPATKRLLIENREDLLPVINRLRGLIWNPDDVEEVDHVHYLLSNMTEDSHQFSSKEMGAAQF